MDYSDFLKYLSQNCNDAKTFLDLAMIEARFGKEAVLGMVSGNVSNPVIPDPTNAFDLLYNFPNLVYTCNNDLQYTKYIGTSSYVYPNGTSSYLSTDSSYIVDPHNQKDFFIFCVHIDRVENNPDVMNNLFIGLPDYVPNGGLFDYLVFNQLPSSSFYIPNHESNGLGLTSVIQNGVSFCRFSRTAFTYEDNTKHIPSSPVEMQQYSDLYLVLFGKKNRDWNFTIYSSLFRMWYDIDDNPCSKLMASYDPFILTGYDETYFLPSINLINITSSIVANDFTFNIIQWNFLSADSKPFLLTDDLNNYLSNIDISN